jgi:hypothetical protein
MVLPCVCVWGGGGGNKQVKLVDQQGLASHTSTVNEGLTGQAGQFDVAVFTGCTFLMHG